MCLVSTSLQSEQHPLLQNSSLHTQVSPAHSVHRHATHTRSYLLVSLFVHLSVCRGGGEAVVKVLVKYDPSVQYSKGYRPVLLGAFRDESASFMLSCLC